MLQVCTYHNMPTLVYGVVLPVHVVCVCNLCV